MSNLAMFSLLQRFDYAKNRYALLDWMVFLVGAGLGTLAWEGSWLEWGYFLADLAGAAACGLLGGGFAWWVLQAIRDA